MYLPRLVNAPMRAPSQPLGKIGRERPAQIGPPQFGPHDPAAGHAQREAAADGFDFGEFRHRGSGRRRAAEAVCAIVVPDEHG